MTLVGVLRWRVEGREHWRRDRGYLVVANHPTLIDIVFLLALFEGADCVVKASAVRNPFWGLLVRAADYVSNEDPVALLEEAAARLEAGRTVVLFPEGTRTMPGQPPAFGAAAGVIATRAGCWCLPAVIGCTPPTLYKNLPWYRVPASRVEFSLGLREPWRVERATGGFREHRHAAREFTRRLEEFYARETVPVRPAEGAGGSRAAANPL
jgi:1-acyl-sn-glycerol-3-phosphate acyltransferase